ncbi:MAG: hypothetical protein ACR2PX_24625 [Endozoicomonas sp.]|uniref:hypothetical protein n=1 Tax=Endozoicomonas sp. TaxID=1892382 RepID=UPI003D9B8DA0
MSDSALIISSERITQEELEEFTHSLNGYFHEEWCYVSEGEGWVGFVISDFYLEEPDFFEESELAEFREALDGEPIQTYLELNFSSQGQSRHLADWLVTRMGERWLIIYDDPEENVLTHEQVANRYRLMGEPALRTGS